MFFFFVHSQYLEQQSSGLTAQPNLFYNLLIQKATNQKSNSRSLLSQFQNQELQILSNVT